MNEPKNFSIDAWTFGSGDPISAASCMLEIARAFGQLMSSG